MAGFLEGVHLEDHTGDEPVDLLYTNCLRCALERKKDIEGRHRHAELRILVGDQVDGLQVDALGYLAELPDPESLTHEGCDQKHEVAPKWYEGWLGSLSSHMGDGNPD